MTIEFKMDTKEAFIQKYKSVFTNEVLTHSTEKVLEAIWKFANKQYSEGYEDEKNNEVYE